MLHLNKLIDELEFLTGTFTEDETPAIVALRGRIDRAGYEHFNLFYGNVRALTDTPEDFQAMVRRWEAAKAAGAAVIAGKETQQVAAGAGADQNTAGVADVRASEPTPLPALFSPHSDQTPRGVA